MSSELNKVFELILEKIKVSSEGVSFDESTHTYKFEDKKIYSVTQILHQLGAYKFQNIPQNVLQHKARIGNMTHYLGELLFNDKTINVETYLETIDPLGLWGADYRNEVLGYWNGMIKYWKENKKLIFASEFRFIDKSLGVAGTIDTLGYDVENECFFINDYKTSASIDLWTQALQICAYGLSLNNILGDTIFTRGCLTQLKKDGTYKEYWFNLEDYVERWLLLVHNFNINILPMLS